MRAVSSVITQVKCYMCYQCVQGMMRSHCIFLLWASSKPLIRLVTSQSLSNQQLKNPQIIYSNLEKYEKEERAKLTLAKCHTRFHSAPLSFFFSVSSCGTVFNCCASTPVVSYATRFMLTPKKGKSTSCLTTVLISVFSFWWLITPTASVNGNSVSFFIFVQFTALSLNYYYYCCYCCWLFSGLGLYTAWIHMLFPRIFYATSYSRFFSPLQCQQEANPSSAALKKDCS